MILTVSSRLYVLTVHVGARSVANMIWVATSYPFIATNPSAHRTTQLRRRILLVLTVEVVLGATVVARALLVPRPNAAAMMSSNHPKSVTSLRLSSRECVIRLGQAAASVSHARPYVLLLTLDPARRAFSLCHVSYRLVEYLAPRRTWPSNCLKPPLVLPYYFSLFSFYLQTPLLALRSD